MFLGTFCLINALPPLLPRFAQGLSSTWTPSDSFLPDLSVPPAHLSESRSQLRGWWGVPLPAEPQLNPHESSAADGKWFIVPHSFFHCWFWSPASQIALHISITLMKFKTGASAYRTAAETHWKLQAEAPGAWTLLLISFRAGKIIIKRKLTCKYMRVSSHCI